MFSDTEVLLLQIQFRQDFGSQGLILPGIAGDSLKLYTMQAEPRYFHNVDVESYSQGSSVSSRTGTEH